MMKWKSPKLYACISFMILIFSWGCEKSPAELFIEEIYYDETYSNMILDLPQGSFMPDNPDFDLTDPDTWTGNMAQFVKRNYTYSITFRVNNSGNSEAYDAEIDLHYVFDNGEEEIETLYLGNLKPNSSINNYTSVYTVNRQLIECWGEVFWYDQL